MPLDRTWLDVADPVLTGHPDINVAVKAGAENFLVKPVSSNQSQISYCKQLKGR
jgi:FixJ family two-component response regulator